MADWLLESVSIVLIIWAVVGGVVLILATVFDILHPQIHRAKRPRRWPQLTVLFDISNRVDGLEDSLLDIRRSRYPNMDIDLVDSSLSPAVKAQIREITKRTKLPVKTFSIRKPRNHHQILYQGYQRSKRGEVVLVIKPGTKVNGVNLRRMSIELAKLDGQKALRLMSRSTSELRLLTITDKLLEASALVAKKALSLANRSVNGLSVDHAYPRQLIHPIQKPIPAQLSPSVTVEFEKPVTQFVEKLVVSLVIFAVILMGAIAIISALLQISTAPLLLSSGLFVFWIIAVVWGDTSSPIPKKLALSLTAPSAYVIMVATLGVRASMKLAQQGQTLFNNLLHQFASKFSQS